MTASARGFTLLEVMVVLVLIGIITSFALLSVGGGSRERLAEEARRLTALVELQQQEAILRSEIRGIQFTATGYTILRQDSKSAWQPLTTADTLTRHELPTEITLGLWVENRPVDLRSSARIPQVVLLSSGEATEFVTLFSLADERGPNAPLYRVSGDALGRLTTNEVAR